MLTVDVRHFGPVSEGAVTSKPLTIFVGRNNSGKSYLAMLFHALHRAALRPEPFRRGPPVQFQHGERWVMFPGPLHHFPEPTEALIGPLGKWLEHMHEEGRVPEKAVTFADLPGVAQTFLSDALLSYFADYVSSLTRELERCYGSEVSKLVTRKQDSSHFAVHLSLEGGFVPWSLNISSSDSNLRKERPKIDLSSLQLSIPPRRVPPASLRRAGLRQDAILTILVELYEELIGKVCAGFWMPTYYFPAARSGILHSHKALASFLVRQSPLVGLERFEIPQLSGVVTDFIGDLLTLDTRRKTELYPIAEALEKTVVDGEVSIESAKFEYPQIFYESAAGKFPLQGTSSMVSELAPIILFLKYIIHPRTFVIIEEPESHLHPANQRRLALGITRLVRAGVKLLLTTHSDYFLTQLSNVIRLSDTDVRSSKAQQYGDDVYLRPEEVGAFLFELNDKTNLSLIRPISVTATEGIPDEEFAKVAQDLYDETAELQR